jgi:hypothetical protein
MPHLHGDMRHSSATLHPTHSMYALVPFASAYDGQNSSSSCKHACHVTMGAPLAQSLPCTSVQSAVPKSQSANAWSLSARPPRQTCLMQRWRSGGGPGSLHVCPGTQRCPDFCCSKYQRCFLALRTISWLSMHFWHTLYHLAVAERQCVVHGPAHKNTNGKPVNTWYAKLQAWGEHAGWGGLLGTKENQPCTWCLAGRRCGDVSAKA